MDYNRIIKKRYDHPTDYGKNIRLINLAKELEIEYDHSIDQIPIERDQFEFKLYILTTMV